MQIELKSAKPIRKRHQPTPLDLEEFGEKYATEDGSLTDPKKITVEDVEYLLECYGTRADTDLYTIADTLNISRKQLYRLLRTEQFAELYEMARARRAELVANKGIEIAGTPFNKMMAGEEVSKEFVVSARNYSNYLLNYAQMFSSGVNNKKSKESQGINIQINIPSLHHIGGKDGASD